MLYLTFGSGMFLGRAVGSTDKKDDDMSGVECGFRVGKKYPRFIGRKAGHYRACRKK